MLVTSFGEENSDPDMFEITSDSTAPDIMIASGSGRA
jgi:hypothetical protein